MIFMPGKSFAGPLPALSEAEERLRDELREDVHRLGGAIGERNVDHPAALNLAAEFIEKSLSVGGFRTKREGYDVRGLTCHNIEAELPGRYPTEIVVVGAHYDSAPGTPGANDNGSGVAALLALARRLGNRPGDRTLRLVAFVNEEPEHFQTELMGSWVYANGCRQRDERITAMLSLETIGYYSEDPGSQHYPAPGLGLIYPSKGNFVAFVGNLASLSQVRQTVGSFRRHAQFPSEGAALPSVIPGVGWSDHWSFWEHGYPGIMVTDTAPFRYPYYHRATDTPDKLNYEGMARVVAGLEKVIGDLVTTAR